VDEKAKEKPEVDAAGEVINLKAIQSQRTERFKRRV